MILRALALSLLLIPAALAVPVSKVAKSLGMSAPTLHCWVKQSRTGTGVFTPKECLEEKAHMREIEAENRRLKIENEILKKATAYFAKEYV